MGTTRAPAAMITSGLSSTRFVAAERMRSMLSLVQRSSNWALTPPAQPRFRSSSRKARTRACASAFVGGSGINIPILRTGPLCCARAGSGHAATVAPRSVIKPRRLMSDIGLLSRWRRRSLRRTLKLPQKGRQVLGADLNRSESTGCQPDDSTRGASAPLHCGISVPPLSAMGQSRRIDMLGAVAACPLRSESGQKDKHFGKSAFVPIPDSCVAATASYSANAFVEEQLHGTTVPFPSLPCSSMCQQQTESRGARFLYQLGDRQGRTIFIGKASDRAHEAGRLLLRGASVQDGH